MSYFPSLLTNTAAKLLQYCPEPVHSWLLYTGIITHVKTAVQPDLLPLTNVCEYLNALHVYADEARRGEVRTVESYHFCSHVRKDLRQCLIYDSCKPDARLIGIEYMIPREKYLTLDPEEQKLWHSHEFEVSSGMLILPEPESHKSPGSADKWDRLELEAMREVVNLYGKTWHTWQVDRDSDLPLGEPRLMGSLTGHEQIDTVQALRQRDERFGVDHKAKAKRREGVQLPGVVNEADSWWQEAKEKKAGIYA